MRLKNIRLELRKSSPAQDLSEDNHGRHSFEIEPPWFQHKHIRVRTREQPHQRLPLWS